MIDLTPEELLVLTWEPVVSAWLGSRWLGDVPVVAGKVTWSARREVQGSIELTVPRWAAERAGEDARDWLPDGDPLHPLERLGQTLTVAIRVSVPGSEPSANRTWLRPAGRFLIAAWEDQGDTVSVRGTSAAGQAIVDDRFTSPTPTMPGGSFASEMRRLIPPTVGAEITGLADRGVPSMSWPESRMDAVQELAKTWPARLREDGTGILRVLPARPSWSPDLVLTDGEGGTVVEALSSASRDGIYNVIVARGQDADNAGIPNFQAISEQLSGPYSTATYGRVVRFFSSPLITSQAAADSSATTMLANELLPALALPVTCASDPRIDMDVPVLIRTSQPDGSTVDRPGWVAGYTMPLTFAADMTLDVELA